MDNSKSQVQQNHQDNNIEEFIVTFRDSALIKLKELARFLNVPEDRLGDVLMKGLHIIDIAKNEDHGEIIIEKKKERLKIDLRKL